MGIIGAILGDIAGSRWEMGRPDDLDWEHIELFTDDCRYTDDTVLTVATAYALTQGTPYVNAYRKFGIAYQNCAYGGAFKNWLDSCQREPYYSYGNGSAMRVAPVVDLAQSESDCVWQAVQSAMCTHNHPEGIKGAVVTAICGWMAKKGASKREIEQFARVEYPADDWTWDDFREIAKQMTSGEGANKIYGAMMDYGGPSEGGGGDQYWQLIAQQKLGSFTYYNDDFTATQFDAPEYKESLQFFYDMAMVDQTLVPISEYTTLKYNSDTNGMIGLYNGKYAMWVAPVYGCLYLNDSYGEVPEGTNIAMANLPRPVGSTENISITYSSQASIPANAPNPEASWALLKFICIEHPELFAGPKAMHPGVLQTPEEAEAMNEIIFGNHPGLDAEQAISIINQDRTLITKDNTHVEGQVKINDLIQADMALVFNGEMSVDEALADLKTKGDQYIQEDMAE